MEILSMKSFAKTINDITFTDYYYRLMMIARSIHKWNNLPNSIQGKWIEKYLYSEGNCLFFRDNHKGFMVAKCTQGGKLNYYDEPTKVTPYGTGYTGEALENNVDCIVIPNNDLLLPTAHTIQLFAYRLAEIQRTIDVNIKAQKTPVMVLCNDKQKLSIKRAMEKVDDNELFIYGDKNLDVSEVKALRMEAPIVFDKLRQEKQNVWNECCTFLGVNNNTQETKKERLVVNEVEANNEQIEASANVFLASRQEACERINKLFDLNISVEHTGVKIPTLEEFEGGADNGKQ